MMESKIVVITETNWLESIVLSQDTAAAYLLRLLRKHKLIIKIPEYSFYEADGSLDKKLLNRVYKINGSLELLKQISRTKHYGQLCNQGRNTLKEIKKVSLDERKKIKEVLDELKSMVDIILYTETSSIKSDLRFESSKAPFKKSDCRIYESILDFLREKGREYNNIIFYTADREDFDHEEIHQELKELNCELHFNSGEVVQRVREL